MAKNLIWRDLPDSVNKALDQYKEHHDMKNNTDAAQGMIEEYWKLKEQLQVTRTELRIAEGKLGRLESLLERRRDIDQSISDYLLNT